jgi:hypothetical protein
VGNLGRKLGLASAFLGAVAVAIWVPGYHFDFVYDWLSAKAFVNGLDPYVPLPQLAASLGLSAETGPIHPRVPGALLLLSPVGFATFAQSYYLGRLLTVGSAFFLAWILARLARRPPFWFMIAVPVLLLVWPFSTVLKVSQPGFFIAGLLGLTWLLGDRWTAGLPLAAAISLKMWPWLLVPALWLDGRRRAAYGCVAAFVGLNVVGLLWPNVTIAGTWRMLSAANEIPSLSISHDLGLAIWVAAAIGLGLVLLVRNRSTYMWSIPIALLVAPILWVAYLPALLVPVFGMVPGQAEKRLIPSSPSDRWASLSLNWPTASVDSWSERIEPH